MYNTPPEAFNWALLPEQITSSAPADTLLFLVTVTVTSSSAVQPFASVATTL